MKKLISAAVVLATALIGSGPVQADGLDYFEAQLKPFYDKPSFVAAGPAFDAKACMAGKSIFSIPVSSANPFTANIEKAMAAAATKVGFKFTIWENQGQSSQWVQGMNAAMNEKASLIDLLAGTDPRGTGTPGSCCQGSRRPRRAIPLQWQGTIRHRS